VPRPAVGEEGPELRLACVTVVLQPIDPVGDSSVGAVTSTPPYSRIRRAGPLWVTAGILGRRDGDLVPGGTGAELDQALANLAALAADAGLGLADVVRLVVYLVDIDDMGLLNDRFTQAFAEPRPARTTVAVAALPGGARVEIEATLASDEGRG